MKYLDNIIDYYTLISKNAENSVSINKTLLEYMTLIGTTSIDGKTEQILYTEQIDDTNSKLNILQTEYSMLVKEMQAQKDIIKEGSDQWIEYTQKVQELEEQIISTQADAEKLYQTLKNLPIEELKRYNDLLKDHQSLYEGMIGLHNAQSAQEEADTYRRLIDAGMAQIRNYQEQNRLLEEQIKDVEIGTERYNALQTQIDSNNNAILAMMTSQEQWNDAIFDVQISALQEQKELLDQQNDALKRRIEMTKALEDLAKAQQRKNLIYREGELSP